MKFLTIILLVVISSTLHANEIKITFSEKPTIYIFYPEELHGLSLYISPDGSATWVGKTDIFLDSNGNIDWERFHIEAKDNQLKAQYNKDTYSTILNICINIIETHEITDEQLTGPGYQSFTISLGGNPELQYRFSSIGDKDFPEDTFVLTEYLRTLLPSTKKLEAETPAH